MPPNYKSSWTTESVRVNRFSEHEWPRQELAAIRHLSIGEEQSESKVVALGWSPPGLGLHKRGVLAVLTSNLVLSLWESNGKPGTWRRALVRRSQRIRAFTWLPPLIHAHAPKWGTHILVVVDDNSLLTYLHVYRQSAPRDGYEVKTVYQHQLLATELPGASDEMSPLQALLLKEARVCRLSAGSWQGGLEHDASRIRLALVRGTEGGPATHNAFTLLFRPTETGAVVEDHAASPVDAAAPKLDGDQSVAAGLERAIADSVQQFNEKHHLGGRVRVRAWGSAADPTGTYAAACITLHPSSMLESVDVSKDNILVPLVTTGDGVQSQADPNPEHAIRRILSWVKAHTNDDNVKSELDIKLLRNTVSIISSEFSQDSELMQWAQEAERHRLPVLTGNDSIQTGNDSTQTAPAASSPESCQWCGADIPLTDPDKLSAARCSNSHVFNRCGLTFVAIQEPGISKYCTRCGKEFLDMSKLEASAAGPSLASALFEEFYVCPIQAFQAFHKKIESRYLQEIRTWRRLQYLAGFIRIDSLEMQTLSKLSKPEQDLARPTEGQHQMARTVPEARSASPALSTHFSDADTLRRSRGSMHSGLTKFSSPSWPGSMKRFMASMQMLKKPLLPPKPKLKITVPAPAAVSLSPWPPIMHPSQPEGPDLTNTSTASSPVDPSYDPDEETPVVQQARSVRVGKAQAVRHVCCTTDSEDIVASSIASNRADALARLEGGAKAEPVMMDIQKAQPVTGSPETCGKFSFSKTPTDYVAGAAEGRRTKQPRDGSILESSGTAVKYSIPRSSMNASTHPVTRPSALLLHLTLTLDRHPPSATHDMTIFLPPNPACHFDDHALFTALRSSYHKHFASRLHCILTPRTLTHK
ncbi:hypothetical protein DV738_g4094, partial [Chaetothyriales sp. CBS 135597]